jgi:ribosomal protein S18 acetylase RimI-like enzyme
MRKSFMATIRKAQPADAPAIARVHVESWRETYAGLVPDDYLQGLSYEKRTADWQRMLAQEPAPWSCHVAQTAEGVLCGFVNCGAPRDDAFRQGEFSCTGEIYAIYLMKESQGQGLGRALFAAAQRSLRSHGIGSFYLWVLRDNKTRAFYRHMGGVELAEKTLEIGGQSLIETAMGWENI